MLQNITNLSDTIKLPESYQTLYYQMITKKPPKFKVLKITGNHQIITKKLPDTGHLFK